MEYELYNCCTKVISLLESLLEQKKITLDEFEKEAHLKRQFIEEYTRKHNKQNLV